MRERVAVGELRSKLREKRLRWLGHIGRRETNYVGKRVKRMKVGEKKRGRAKRRWEDCIKEDMEKMGVYEDDANDRKRWREMICTGNPI